MSSILKTANNFLFSWCFRLIYFGGYGCRKHNELSDCFDVHDAFWVRDLLQFSVLSFLVKARSVVLCSVGMKNHESCKLEASALIWNFRCCVLLGGVGCSVYSKC